MEEFAGVLAGAVGYAADYAFLVEKRIVHGWNCAHGDAGESEGASLAEDAQGLRDKSSGGCEDYGGIEWMRGRVFGAPDPCGAEAFG